MAGIGFALRRLARSGSVGGMASAYVQATLVSTGPWLLTILAVGGINFFTIDQLATTEIAVFRVVVIYNFAFSLTFSGPVVLIVTRYLADCIYAKNVEEAPGALLGALGLLFLTQAPLAIAFYGFVAALPENTRVVAIVSYLLTAALWLVTVFLSALKDFRSITITFIAGMALGTVSGIALFPAGADGLLTGFDIGLAFIFFVLMARILAEYPYPLLRPLGFIGYFGRYWQLAVYGFAYNAAIWIDKWIMWFAPQRSTIVAGMPVYPAYDGAMFLAYLTIIPAMAMFVVNIETDFFEHYLDYHRDIEEHATLAQLRLRHTELTASLHRGLRNAIVLQGTISYVTILLAPALFDQAGLDFGQLVIFRFGVLGALFHALLLFMLIVMAYFDMRGMMLGIGVLFLSTNGLFSLASLHLGFAYYGYGYCLASIVCFATAYALVMGRMKELPYLTFVTHNPSVRRR